MKSINWSEVLGWNADSLEDLRYLGYAYLKQGKFDAAQSFFEALVAINKENHYDLQTLGALYLEMGKNIEALSLIEQALKLDPNHAGSLLNRVKALFALGYRRQAVAQARVLENNSDKIIANQVAALLLAYT
jgi:tetratricopeptide (TPR) repeat protein